MNMAHRKNRREALSYNGPVSFEMLTSMVAVDSVDLIGLLVSAFLTDVGGLAVELIVEEAGGDESVS